MNAKEQNKKMVDRLEMCIADMREAIIKRMEVGSIVMLLDESLSQAAIREQTFHMVKWLRNSDYTIEEMSEEANSYRQQLIDDLCGVGFCNGGRGPWRHNSTCPYQNEINIIECDAKREAIGFLKQVIDCINEELYG